MDNGTLQKFFLYARKSTDVEDKQVLSIEAQITELREFAKREGINIVKEFVEKQSAKIPGRPVFNEMIARIEKGEANEILSWHPDRLARNSVDGGRIIYLLDIGKLQSLKFPQFWFEPTPQGKFVLQIAFGQSKYYVDNLSENVKRGNRQKLRRGEWPNWAPPGYKNDKNTRSIIVDPEKAPLVKKLFVEYSTGKHTLREMEKLCLNWHLFSRNNKPLHISSIQRILRNSFYIGLMKYNGEVFEGKHEPIISKKLFELVQKVIASKSRKIEIGKYYFVFRDLKMKCGECERSITAEQHIKKSGLVFRYYRCTKKYTNCSQPYIEEKQLAEQLFQKIQKVSLKPLVVKKAICGLERLYKQDLVSSKSGVQNLKKEIALIKEKLSKLLDAHLENVVSLEEYQQKKNELLERKHSLTQKMSDFQRHRNNWLEL